MSSNEHWYKAYLGKGPGAQHAGFYHVRASRDEEGHRVLDCHYALRGEHEGHSVDHDAQCRVVLERRGGRYVPLKVQYSEPSHAARMTFEGGRLHATGAAAGHDGASLPDDVIPTYAISVLAEEIYRQTDARLTFCAITEGTGAICAAEAMLLARGQTEETPFPSAESLWQVDWLSHERTVLQSFYFTDEGVLAQADWGTTSAVRVEDSRDAVPAGFRVPGLARDTNTR